MQRPRSHHGTQGTEQSRCPQNVLVLPFVGDPPLQLLASTNLLSAFHPYGPVSPTVRSMPANRMQAFEYDKECENTVPFQRSSPAWHRLCHGEHTPA